VMVVVMVVVVAVSQLSALLNKCCDCSRGVLPVSMSRPSLRQVPRVACRRQLPVFRCCATKSNCLISR